MRHGTVQEHAKPVWELTGAGFGGFFVRHCRVFFFRASQPVYVKIGFSGCAFGALSMSRLDLLKPTPCWGRPARDHGVGLNGAIMVKAQVLVTRRGHATDDKKNQQSSRHAKPPKDRCAKKAAKGRRKGSTGRKARAVRQTPRGCAAAEAVHVGPGYGAGLAAALDVVAEPPGDIASLRVACGMCPAVFSRAP